MAGSSIFDYVHQGDHAEVAEQLGLSLTGHSQGMSSPSSSDEGTHGTMNPDGEYLLHVS
jgi:neuronal PAS domain-containing protein 1/3